MTTVVKYIRLDAELAEWLRQEAARENRTFRNYVETVLQQHRNEQTETSVCPECGKVNEVSCSADRSECTNCGEVFRVLR